MLPVMLRRGLPTALDALHEDFDRLLSRWWGDAGTEALGAYPVDISEDDDHVYVQAELPGFTKDQIDVTIENGVLSIQAQRQTPETKGQQHLRERRFTRVARSFTLPNTVDETKVDCKLENGVLNIKLNKREEVKPRRIEIK